MRRQLQRKTNISIKWSLCKKCSFNCVYFVIKRLYKQLITFNLTFNKKTKTKHLKNFTPRNLWIKWEILRLLFLCNNCLLLLMSLTFFYFCPSQLLELVLFLLKATTNADVVVDEEELCQFHFVFVYFFVETWTHMNVHKYVFCVEFGANRNFSGFEIKLIKMNINRRMWLEYFYKSNEFRYLDVLLFY